MVILLLLIIVGVILIVYYMQHNTATQTNDVVEDKKLLSLTETTLAERQRYYKRGLRQQMQYDELQRRAEAAGDTGTLESIRLGTYDGPLPTLAEDIQSPIKVVIGSDDNKNAPVQELRYFCVRDKGYHVSVWPKNQRIGDYERFTIAGLSHRDNINDYLGEFKGTLEAEPTNEYDPNAIKVLAPDGHHVGYVPSDQTRFIREFTELPCSCYCYIGCNSGTYFSDCFINRNN